MKNVVITGVSRGIGKALAQKFLAAGFFVIGTSTKGQTDLKHENLIVLQLDLSIPQSIEQCAIKILDLNKPIEILINNAAIFVGQDDKKQIYLDVLRKTLEVDLIGQIDFAQRVLTAIKDNGHIVNVSSRFGSLTNTTDLGDPSYRISKAGLNMFTRILASKLKNKVTVSSVHPGSVQTDMGMAGAPMTPEEAADDLYQLAVSRPESGQFWFKGEKLPW